MGLSNEEEFSEQHKDLCVQLNLEQEIVKSSWDKFQKIYRNFTLEGDVNYWLGCAIFEACQSNETTNMDQTTVKGSCVNLTSLLRYSNLSFTQFFEKITKWTDMANLSADFRAKIAHLRETFSVAFNTFNEFHTVYTKIFQVPDTQELDTTKQHRNRKQKPVVCTSSKIFEFVWNLYIIIKLDDPKFSTDLTKSYHLIYSCIDLAFKNAFMADRRDILQATFVGLPENWHTASYELPEEAPCVIKCLCKCDSLISEALHNKTYVFKDKIQTLIDKDILSGANEQFVGLFEPAVFESNLKSLTKYYEMILLSKCGFDERIFLAEYRRQLLEQQQQQLNTNKVLWENADCSIMESPRMPPPGLETPLSGRRLVGPGNGDSEATASIKSVNCLLNLLNGRSAGPGDKLLQLFESCANNPKDLIETMVKEMGDIFIKEYPLQSAQQTAEAENRLEIATKLFYKFTENILVNESTLRSDISTLVNKIVFYKCAFGCALEIVIFVYDNHRKFPWILDTLKIEAYDFVKVVELIVRSKDVLSRHIIKHLSRVEETVLESVVWKSDSILWNFIAVSADIPKFVETARPEQISHNERKSLATESPLNRSSSATEAFQSPVNSNVSRQLFPVQAGQSVLQRPAGHLIFTDTNGQNRLIPLIDIKTPEQTIEPATPPQPALPPRRTGSLAIFFRKFYNLAGDRLDHLCSNLTNQDLKPKIWTIFEDSIINHTNLMKDRHLDQLLMCAVYVIVKVCNENIMFTDVMKWYRRQPQAESEIYRTVLLKPKRVEQRDGQDVQIPETRGDLIFFYNNTYVNEMKTMALKFAPNQTSNMLLSPSPVVKRPTASNRVQLVGNVFIKPLDIPSNGTNGANSNLCYFFNRSPSKELLNINRAIKNTININGKRLLEDENGLPLSKRTSSMRKIQSLCEERQSQIS